MIGKLIANTNNDKGSGALRNSLQNNDQKKVGASSKVFQSLLKVLKGDISTKEGQLLTVAPSTKGEDTVQEAGNDTILDKEKLATLHSHNIIKDEKHLSQDEGSDFLRQQLLGQSLAGNELLENDGQKQTGTAKINSAAEPKKTEQVQGKLGEAAVHNLAVEKEPAEKASSKPTTVEMKKESGKPLREIPHKMVNNSSRGENKGKPESGVSHTVSRPEEGGQKLPDKEPKVAVRDEKVVEVKEQSISTGLGSQDEKAAETEKATSKKLKGAQKISAKQAVTKADADDKSGLMSSKESEKKLTEVLNTKAEKTAKLFENIKSGEAKSAAGVKGKNMTVSWKVFETTKRQGVKEITIERNQHSEVPDGQKKLNENILMQNNAGTVLEKGLEEGNALSEKLGKKKEKKSKLGYTIRHRERGNSERGPLFFTSRPGQPGLASATTEQAVHVPTNNSNSNVVEQNIMWEQQATESVNAKEEKEASKNSVPSSTMRLGQMSVPNVVLRRRILPGLTKSVLKATSEAKKNPDQWQKHSFVLDDGKNIQLSVREAKGILQVKMGSINLDLSKLLQQNLHQIREHLKQEFGADIDLQFENSEQQNSSEFSDDFSSSSDARGHLNRLSNEKMKLGNADQVNLNSVRNFGYNQMEWTA